MKSVSWGFAFRKLNEWANLESPLAFGNVFPEDVQGETINIFSGASGTRVIKADEQTGMVSLFGEGDLMLTGASFKFSDFEDSPFIPGEGIGSMEDAMEQLEAAFPDGRILVFARLYDF
jgi:hypothetical protein